MNKGECLNANWKLIGFEDGSFGRPLEQISNHRSACAKHNVTPNLDEYTHGHKDGLNHYCVASKGFALGRSGSAYNYLCPSKLRPAFKRSYEEGITVYKAANRVAKLKTALDETSQELDAQEQEIADAEAIIISSESTQEERKTELDRLDSLKNELLSLDDNYHAAERRLKRAELELQRLNSKHY